MIRVILSLLIASITSILNSQDFQQIRGWNIFSDSYADDMEFDACNEFNVQGVIANTWPEYILKRWSDLIRRPNVIGYVAHTDRYGYAATAREYHKRITETG